MKLKYYLLPLLIIFILSACSVKHPPKIITSKSSSFSSRSSSSSSSTTQKTDSSNEYDVILTGDLTFFEGNFTTNNLNQTIVDSEFTYGGYTPQDYYNNQTTVFPSINDNTYWNGIVSHGSYEIRDNDLPTKVNDYYEVHFYGTNLGANNGEMKFYLVPPNVKGPDNHTVNTKQVFQIKDDGALLLLQYQTKDWWKNYQSNKTTSVNTSINEDDLDTNAILDGDFHTLTGNWKNGNGNMITIDDEGRISGDGIIQLPAAKYDSSIPAVSVRYGNTSSPLLLFKIGFKNPEGDQSDSSRSRIMISQTYGNYPAELYFYRN